MRLMGRMMRLVAILLVLSCTLAGAAPKKLHKIAAVVGGEVILTRQVQQACRAEVEAFRERNKGKLNEDEMRRGLTRIVQAKLEAMIREKLLEMHAEGMVPEDRKEWLRKFRGKPEVERREFLDELEEKRAVRRKLLE